MPSMLYLEEIASQATEWRDPGSWRILTHTHNRLVPKHRMITNQKSGFSLKIDILIHNWASEKICSVRYTQYQYVLFWKSGKWLYLIPQNSTRSRPPKAADFFGCFFRLLYRQLLEVQNKIYTYWVYLMEHICFEVQLCIEISIFNEFCENWYIYHSTLANSLTDCLRDALWMPSERFHK